jgi:hypothetical protein
VVTSTRRQRSSAETRFAHNKRNERRAVFQFLQLNWNKNIFPSDASRVFSFLCWQAWKTIPLGGGARFYSAATALTWSGKCVVEREIKHQERQREETLRELWSVLSGQTIQQCRIRQGWRLKTETVLRSVSGIILYTFGTGHFWKRASINWILDRNCGRWFCIKNKITSVLSCLEWIRCEKHWVPTMF